jgi:hypothetical protein
MIYQDRCPKCGYDIDAASAIGKDPTALPDEDDYSICLNCGALLQFDSLLRLHAVLDPERALGGLDRELRMRTMAARLHIWIRGRLR